ncbi:MAG: beta-propeller fold lactonase family protein [Acidobacteriales bacterium]|nr:beta-propeller fold lactonase family protein [Terriglobales bacterium]
MAFRGLWARSSRLSMSAVLGCVLLCCALGAHAQKNLVYINGDITATGQNAVLALINDGSGNMSPVTGSPFATKGTGVAGTGDPLADTQWDSEGEIVTNPQGALLYVVNGHSNDFSGFSILPDGSLSLIAGSPFPSGGTQPASIGYKDNALGNGLSLMVIANKDSDPFQKQTAPNYTSFQVSAAGVPTMNPGGKFPQPAGSSPAQILVPPNAPQYFFGIMYLGKNVGTYKLDRAGVITKTSSLTTSGKKVGSVLNPKVKGFYTTEPNVDKLSVFSYDASFNLSSLSTLASPGNAPCWAATNKAGTRLYIGETLSGSVTVYDITNSKNPLQLQHLVLSGTMPYATHTRLDPTEKFLYVLDRQGVLHVLDVLADGTVSENRAPYNLGLPSGTVPLGLAVLSK